jgi:integrase
MTTLSYYLKKRKNKIEHPLYLRVTHRRESRYIRLNINLEEVYWNQEKEAVRKSHPRHEKINRFLKVKMMDSETLLLELKQLRPEANFDTVQEVLEAGSLDGIKKDTRAEFICFAEELRLEFKKKGSYQRYKNYGVVINKLQDFCPKKRLFFDEINPKFLRRFETFLMTKYGNNENTVTNNMKKIRRVFNVARNENLIPIELYPFRNYKMPSKPVNKTKLTAEEIAKIEDLELTAGTRMYDSRNLFLFAYYCRGMRFRDVIALKWKNVKGDHLEYEMSKTRKRITLRLIPQAQRILKLYKGNSDVEKDHFVFPFLDARKDYSVSEYYENQVGAKNALVNKYLSEIKKKADIEEHISFHIARHSFAQLANKKDIRLLDIKDMLGHSSVDTTMNYLESLGDDHLDNTVAGLFN